MTTSVYCRHVKEDGIPCGSPPLRGEGYCYFHLRYKGYPLRTWRYKQRLGGLHITRRTVFSLKALQVNLKRVEKMLASGACPDPERARMICYALQIAISDLRYIQDNGDVCQPNSHPGSDKSSKRSILR